MSEHYTQNTVEASAWCSICAKHTPHRVAGKRLAYCLPCFERSERQSAANKTAAAKAKLAAFHEGQGTAEEGKPAPAEQRRLFDDL
jgi:hypothetical protein